MSWNGGSTRGTALFTLNQPALNQGDIIIYRMLSLVVDGDIGFIELGQVRLVVNLLEQVQLAYIR